MIAWAPSWGWIIAANALLGINQGFAWSMTVIMKVDLVGPKSRGLAVGLNEFAGYLSVGVTAFLTGYSPQRYGLRPRAVLSRHRLCHRSGLLFRSSWCATRAIMSAWKSRSHRSATDAIGFWEVFAPTSFGDRNLFAASQAGLVNNLNDGMSWGIFPLFFAAFGLGVERIGILKAVYPAVWGVLQIVTGPLSDRWGRKGLIVAGMWVQAGGLFLTAATREFGWWLVGQPAARARHGHGLSDADRGGFRCFASFLAGAFAERLPLLARSRLRHRRAFRRHHRRPLRRRLGDRCHWRAHLRLGRRGRHRHERTART